MSKLTINNDRIEVQFPYDPKRIALIRTVFGRKWHRDSRCWSVPISEAGELEKLGFGHIKVSEKPASVVPRLMNFGKIPMPFQQAGFSFIETHSGRALIGDEMGLGKTIQALMYLHNHPELRPALIICPNPLKLNWKREIDECLGLPADATYIIDGQDHVLPSAEIYIINYDKLANKREKHIDLETGKKKRKAVAGTGWVDFLPKFGFKLLIIDEVQALANWSADRTKDTIKYLHRHKGALIALSGTPITSRPIQFYPILNVLLPQGTLPPWKTYGITYCNGKHNGFGWDFKGASNLEKLRALVSRVMIRRLKKDVLPELPEKVRTAIPLPINCKQYAAAERDWLKWLKEVDPEKLTRAERAAGLVRTQLLQEMARKARWPETLDWIKSLLEAREKLIVFGKTYAAVDSVFAATKKYNPVKIDGRQDLENRKQQEAHFQTDENCRLIVGTMQAMGAGLTLTAGNGVVFVEMPWNPGTLDQAEDRPHRIGQRGTVNVYYLLAQGSIEMGVANLLDSKRKTLAALLDGDFSVSEDSMLLELMRKFKKNVTA